MDLRLYLRVLWRFRLLVLIGFLLAAALGFLSYIRIDLSGGSPSFSYRQNETWRSDATLWVTRNEAPYLELTNPEHVTRTADFPALAVILTRLARSDAVKALMLEKGPLNGSVQITTLLAADQRSNLPFLIVAGFSTSPAGATEVAQRQIDALITFVKRQQAQQAIPERRRILIEVLRQPSPPVLAHGRTFTRPAVLFLSVMIVVVALAFVLENIRPRIRPVSDVREHRSGGDVSRRSA